MWQCISDTYSLMMASGGFHGEAGRPIGLRFGAKDQAEGPPCGKQPTDTSAVKTPAIGGRARRGAPAAAQGYLERCPQLAGHTFGEAAFYFPDATIFALVQASRRAPPHAPPANCRAALLVPILCEDAVHISA